MTAYLDWSRDGADWPNRASSRFVDAHGLRWHVQVAGNGPVVLLLHGTGASTHSWRDVLPRLAANFTVVAPDLPGHGFTSRFSKASVTLPGMAAAVAGLVNTLGLPPKRIAGHSAGAAVAVRMAVERLAKPDRIVSFNGAFFPFGGLAGQLFSPIAKVIAGASFMQRMFARRADNAAVQRLLNNTGSKIDEDGFRYYQRLFANEGHVAGALAMMANWDLHGMPQDLKNLLLPLDLVRGTKDNMVQPSDAEKVAQLAPRARIIDMAGLGHLAHEEEPAKAADLIAGP